MEIKYKDSNNAVHQIEEGFEHLMSGWPVGYTQITDAEAATILNPPKTNDQLWADYKASALSALSASDKTVLRIQEAVSLGKTTLSTPDVVAYMQHRADLRAILTMAQPATIPTALPSAPYPANT